MCRWWFDIKRISRRKRFFCRRKLDSRFPYRGRVTSSHGSTTERRDRDGTSLLHGRIDPRDRDLELPPTGKRKGPRPTRNHWKKLNRNPARPSRAVEVRSPGRRSSLAAALHPPPHRALTAELRQGGSPSRSPRGPGRARRGRPPGSTRHRRTSRRRGERGWSLTMDPQDRF
jgi:hypothetical protein